MNRRDFTKRMAALAAVPAFPTTLSAGTAQAATAARHPAHLAASVMARVENKCSPGLLARRFGLDSDTAQTLFTSLQREGIVSASNANGVATAINPFRSTLTKGTANLLPKSLRPKPPADTMPRPKKINLKVRRALESDRTDRVDTKEDEADALEEQAHLETAADPTDP